MPNAPEFRRTLVAVWIANFLTAMGLMSMVPWLTYVVEDLGVTEPAARNLWSGALVGIAPVLAAFMGPIWGSIGDRHGRRRMVLRALLAVTLTTGGMSFARSPWLLLFLRVGQGLFSGFVPASMSYVSAMAAAERQSRVAAGLQTAMPAGQCLGFVLGGELVSRFGMSAIFPFCSALGALGFLIILVAAPVDVVVDRGSTEEKGTRGFFGRLVQDTRDLARFEGMPALLTGIFLIRAFTAAADPLYARFVETLGGDPRGAGRILGSQAVSLLLGMLFWGRVGDRRPSAFVLMTAGLGLGLTLLAHGFVGSIASLYVLRAGSGFFIAGIYPAAYGMAGRASRPDRRGHAIGVVFFCFALAQALGAFASGGMVNLFGFRRLFLASGLLVILGGNLPVLRRLSGTRSGSRG